MIDREAPMAKLIQAMRQLDVLGGAAWEARQIDVSPHPKVRLCRDGETLIEYVMSPVGAAETVGAALVVNTAVVTVLNTAIELAGFAYRVSHLEHELANATTRAEGWKEEFEHVRAERDALDRDRRRTEENLAQAEVRELRLIGAIVNTGAVGLLAQCPFCLAERTNGERHEPFCSLANYTDLEAGRRTESRS